MTTSHESIVVGFTGTRKGMTDAQKQSVELILIEEQPREAHHGSAIGADADFHQIALSHGISIITHPCIFSNQRAECAGAVKTLERHDPLVRNQHIVDALDVLIACPGGMTEELRSGTWATVRRARRDGKRIVICWPDGLITTEGGRVL